VQEGEFVAAATFQQLLMQTSADDWQEGLQVHGWLCCVAGLTVSCWRWYFSACIAPVPHPANFNLVPTACACLLAESGGLAEERVQHPPAQH
jgi:hypothetical protein